MSQNTCCRFAGQHPAIDLDGALVWNKIHLHSATNHTDIAGSRAEQWVPVSSQICMVLFKCEDDACHV